MHSRQYLSWQHTAPLHIPFEWRDWLLESSSLTARLQGHCHIFEVQRLAQYIDKAYNEEQRLLKLQAAKPIWCREVLLRCDSLPVIFARTVVCHQGLQRDWPFFRGLKQRSLGTRLFVDPLVDRKWVRYTKLNKGHPFYQRTHQALDVSDEMLQNLYARSALFVRCQGKMLVTEVFLPSVFKLNRTDSVSGQKNL